MRTHLINQSNAWFALASTAIFLSIYALGGSLLTAFLVPFIISMVVELALYFFRSIKERISGMALFVRITTSLIPNLILFYAL